MDKKLYLLDAMALIFRAYYALIRSPRITSTGKNTSAQFGFTNTLIELIQKEKPTHLAVCFDTKAPTARHTDFEAYKANRQEAPEDLLAAIPDIKKIIHGFNIPTVELDGYEADDIIGTLAWKAADAGYEVYMVTPDKDYGQLLIHPNVFIYKPAYMGNPREIMDAQAVCKKWDIANVTQVVDILGLMGDAVDNIPGIAGVGEKTASKLLKEYHSVEGILAHADEIKGALGDKVRAGKEAAIMSKKLATIITDVPVELDEHGFTLSEWDRNLLNSVFAELEFRTLGKRILGEGFQVAPTHVQTDLFGNVVEPRNAIKNSSATEGETPLLELKNASNTTHRYELTDTEEKRQQLVWNLQKEKEICFDTETTGLDANNVELVGMSFAIRPDEAFYVPVPANQTQAKALLETFKPLFAQADILWIGQNIKYDLLVMKWYGIEFPGPLFDTMVAHYLIEPDGRRNMDLLSEQFLGYQPIPIEELIGKKGKGQLNMRDVPFEKIKEYAAEDADITLQLKHKIEPLLVQKGVRKIFDDVDQPLVKVLAAMEFEGIRIDEKFLREYSVLLEQDAKQYEENVYAEAGVRFNLASPKQLGEVLFDKLKLDPRAKKTKTGQYATGEDVLTKLAVQNKIVDDILGFRELTKLRNTYVDALPLMINPRTGRVHTSYNQTIAVTGRLSSNNPNLQNIPVRTERGKEIRKAFIPRDENHILLSADYSQIELRIVAAVSGDKHMCEAFKEGKDIHLATAAKVFGVAEEDVTKEMRRRAKSVNFGIIYGQSAFGLAGNLGISRMEAKDIIDSYMAEFPGISKYMEKNIAFAQEHGYAETLMGRKNWLKDINSSNHTVRSFAERAAINSPIQGTAADMIKLAMIHIQSELQKRHLQSKMLLQVHDELVFDVLMTEKEEMAEIIPLLMRNALPLPNGVPALAETGFGTNWLEAH